MNKYVCDSPCFHLERDTVFIFRTESCHTLAHSDPETLLVAQVSIPVQNIYIFVLSYIPANALSGDKQSTKKLKIRIEILVEENDEGKIGSGLKSQGLLAIFCQHD